jgi:hypothetical protein
VVAAAVLVKLAQIVQRLLVVLVVTVLIPLLQVLLLLTQVAVAAGLMETIAAVVVMQLEVQVVEGQAHKVQQHGPLAPKILAVVVVVGLFGITYITVALAVLELLLFQCQPLLFQIHTQAQTWL